MTTGTDLAVITFLVAVTGGSASPFYYVYFIVLVSNSIRYGMAMAVFVALAFNITYVVVLLVRPVGGDLTAEGVKIARGQWHTLTLRAQGDRFTVLFNDKPLHATTDSTPAPRPVEGRVGLWVKSDSVSHFDRIEIKKLP